MEAEGLGLPAYFLTGTETDPTAAGSDFQANTTIYVTVTPGEDYTSSATDQQRSDHNGAFSLSEAIPCVSGTTLHFMATDGRLVNGQTLYSNTFNTTC